MKTKQIWLALITIGLNSCLIAMIVLLTSCSSHEQQPDYNGKTLSEWLSEVDKEKQNETNQVAWDSIRKIGTNAIPFLLNEINESSELEKKVDDTDKSYETRLRLYHINLAFAILGPIAKPAVPELMAMLNNGTNFGFAAYALTQIDPQTAAVALTQALTNNNVQTLISAVHGLALVASNADVVVAVPRLIQCLKSKSSEQDLLFLKLAAVETLGDIHARPDIAVPALVEILTNTSITHIRISSIHALGKFGSAAISALPILEQVTNDSNENLRLLAVAALEKIQRPSQNIEVCLASFGLLDNKDNLTPTNRISHQVGVQYAWRLMVLSSKSKVRVKEVFKLPGSAHWGGDASAVDGLKTISDWHSQSGDMKITEYDLEIGLSGDDESEVTMPYKVNDTDPQGAHNISIFVEGKLIKDFTFQVVDEH